MNMEFGFGGMPTIDVETLEKANALMEMMQNENLGYLAVSLGLHKTHFYTWSSTSSEIPEDEQRNGLFPGPIRFSVGLDNDIERTFQAMQNCMKSAGVL